MAIGTTSREEAAKLRRLSRVVDLFRVLDAEMQAQTIATFLLVATDPGTLNVKDVAARLGIQGSSASRNVAALSEHHRLGRAGHNVVVSHEDPADRRHKLLNLTPKGRKLVYDLLQALA